MILPAIMEAGNPLFRAIKYSLFPPLGLATLAAYLNADDEVELIDQHVEKLNTDDQPDLVIIQVYITNAYRAYKIADKYRNKGVHVAMGGLHVTSCPEEALQHADSIFSGPGEQTFPEFLHDFRNRQPRKIYAAPKFRCIKNHPPIRRELIKRQKYLVPNTMIVSRGCIHHCDFCYKDAFFKGGNSFYTKTLDHILTDIDRLPGKHLYFLDDHLFADYNLMSDLFREMKGMNRVFQGAATVKSIIQGDLIEKAADAGMKSVFVGFETFSPENLRENNKLQNLNHEYETAVRRLQSLGIMINGSFVFGMDNDDKDVFKRTVDWGIEHSLTTATYHILTPYPGTPLHSRMKASGRIITENWDLYNTRNTVFQPVKLSPEELEEGYWWSYNEFYKWNNIIRSSLKLEGTERRFRQLLYTGAWKKFEWLWKIIINTGTLQYTLPILEYVLSGKEKITLKELKKLILAKT